jgi:dihydroorotate dehydrogenase electron transfer subunit
MTALAGTTALEIEVGLAAPEPGPRAVAPFGRRRRPVRVNDGAGAYRLVGADDSEGPAPLPGQFYMLAAAEDWGEGNSQRPYLARAFSVCRRRGKRLDFLVEDLGPGTRRLARLEPGEDLWLVGPLGIGFSEPSVISPDRPDQRALLVGGGAGLAPLVIWKEALEQAGLSVRVLLGFRSAAYCGAAELLGAGVELATDDGSVGHHGLVTELLEAELERASTQVVYACGPPRMLEAVRQACADRSVPAQLALEEAMACGFGACFGCVVKTTTGYRRLCIDGPVVSAADLDESWL